MKAKKLLALLMCALFCATAFLVSCQDEGEESSQVNSAATGGENLEDFVDMPEFTWKDNEDFSTFNVCIYSNEVQTTYFCEDVVPALYSTTDQSLSEAVTKRNNEIEAKYGVTITASPVKDVVESLKLDITSSMGEYDAGLPFMKGAATLAQEAYLYDLREFSDYIHLDQKWWDQSANEALSIGDKLYFTTGDISIMPKIVSIAVTFNKDMLKKNFPEVNLYDMVRNNEWTFDKMVEMSKKVTADTDGKSGMTYDDTWGTSSSYGDAVAFFIGAGENMIRKDSDDIPVLALDKQSAITSVQKILEQLQLPDEWCFHAETVQDSSIRWVVSLDIFGQNRALFRTSAFSAIKKLRAYDDCEEFGIVPLPRVSETQDDYYTYCNAAYAYCAVIPSNHETERANFAAYMLELMAFGGMKYITPAYYETTLKYRDFRDEESEEMLDDYIFDNIVYDLGTLYDFGGVHSIFNSLMSANSLDIVSELDSKKSGIETAIQDCVEGFGI
ncbi:MAG: extracellular solute-binding protein [Clostridia bacterium]|nr:extracellular solute-binding protein [Clostridia bacterium]